MNRFRRGSLRRIALAAMAAGLLPVGATASGLPGRDAVVVTPGQEGLAGDADAASQGVIDEEQLENRPLLRPAEVRATSTTFTLPVLPANPLRG